jgi:hypothetical protein
VGGQNGSANKEYIQHTMMHTTINEDAEFGINKDTDVRILY